MASLLSTDEEQTGLLNGKASNFDALEHFKTDRVHQIWSRFLVNGRTAADIQDSVNARRGSALIAAAANFVKGMMGAGLLSLPYAFYLSGLLMGLATFLFVLLVASFGCIVLIKCKREANLLLKGDAYNGPIISYLDLATAADPKLEIITALFTILCSVTFCTGWIIVINNNITKHLPDFFVSSLGPMPVLWVFPVLLLLSCLRYVKQLAYVSYFGCAVYLFGVIGLSMVYGFSNFSLDSLSSEWLFRMDFSNLPVYLSLMLYPIAVFISVLPLEATLVNPKQGFALLATGYPAIGIVAVVYGALMGSSSYGSCSVILNCLPQGPATYTAEGLLTLVLICTFPLGLQYATDLIEARFFTERTKLRYIIAVRAVLCSTACLIGALVPDFSIFSSFASPLLFSVLGFILPPILYIKIKGWRLISIRMRIALVLLGVFGITYSILGVIQAVRNLL